MSLLIFSQGYVKEGRKWELKDGNEPQFSNPRVSWAWGKEQRRSHSGAADYKVWGGLRYRQEMMKPGWIPTGKQDGRKLMLVLMLKRRAESRAAGKRKRNRPFPTISNSKLQVSFILASVPETLAIITISL